MSSEQARRHTLLTAIRTEGGDWPTGRAHKLYRHLGYAPGRRTARTDLRYWARQGALTEDGPDDARSYRLNYQQGAVR